MAQVLEYALRLNDRAFSTARARGEVGALGGGIRGVTSQAGGVSSLGGAFGGLGGKIAVVTGVVATLGAAFAGLKTASGSAADMETLSVAFETLVGDATLARETLAELKQFGAETPLEFPDIANAAKLLVAFGESAETVTATLRRVGDISSGVGANIGEIAEIYGKARVAGTLYAEDINQLVGRGIPVIQEFAKQLGVSEGEVKKMASEGQVTFPMLEQAFKALTGAGGKFANMMQKQSQTHNGLTSTLKDNIGAIFTTLGQPVNDMLRPMLQSAINTAGTLNAVLSNAIAKGQVGAAISNALTLGAKMGVNAIVSLVESIPARVMGALGTLAAAIEAALSGSLDVAQNLLQSFRPGAMRFDTSQEMQFFKDLTAEASKAKKAADGVKTSVAAVVAPAAAGAAAGSGAAGGGAEGATGRKRIQGFSYAASGANSGFGGLGEFDRLQEKTRMTRNTQMPAGLNATLADVRGGIPTNAAFRSSPFRSGSAPGGTGAAGAAEAAPSGGMKRRMMSSGLDEFHSRNGTVGMPPAMAPRLPSPGAVKKEESRRESAQAKASGGTHPLESAIAGIAAKLGTLTAAT